MTIVRRAVELFISYPGGREDIAENLRGRLREFGVEAWVYSYDRLLATDIWDEIKRKLGESRAIAFLVGNSSPHWHKDSYWRAVREIAIPKMKF